MDEKDCDYRHAIQTSEVAREEEKMKVKLLVTTDANLERMKVPTEFALSRMYGDVVTIEHPLLLSPVTSHSVFLFQHLF